MIYYLVHEILITRCADVGIMVARILSLGIFDTFSESLSASLLLLSFITVIVLCLNSVMLPLNIS